MSKAAIPASARWAIAAVVALATTWFVSWITSVSL